MTSCRSIQTPVNSLDHVPGKPVKNVQFKTGASTKEAEKCNQMVFSIDRQLDVLAERLATLPSEISPTPIYKQMEKLEGKKREAQNKLTEMESSGFVKDEPCELKDFKKFLLTVEGLLRMEDNLKIRQKIIRYLVNKIFVLPDGFEVHFNVGETYVKVFMNNFEKDRTRTLLTAEAKDSSDQNKALPETFSGNASQFFGHFSSNTCKSGALGRN